MIMSPLLLSIKKQPRGATSSVSKTTRASRPTRSASVPTCDQSGSAMPRGTFGNERARAVLTRPVTIRTESASLSCFADRWVTLREGLV